MALTYDLTRSWLKALAFILVDYSCVLKAATSIIYILAINERVERGIIIKGARYVKASSDTDMYVLDKTGILTINPLIIQDVHPFDDYTVEDVLRIGPA
ncbi:hypothetical protein [Dolosigranulum pigrum]|uniref:hypothetical protein n=1 Tax=Dolosigranulum pigrum TaxID=29394 RepID=UPI0011BD1510|nr:hypothetical protein [Dolosigranulum pigrum]